MSVCVVHQLNMQVVRFEWWFKFRAWLNLSVFKHALYSVCNQCCSLLYNRSTHIKHCSCYLNCFSTVTKVFSSHINYAYTYWRCWTPSWTLTAMSVLLTLFIISAYLMFFVFVFLRFHNWFFNNINITFAHIVVQLQN